MADFVTLAKTEELPPGTKKAVFAAGKQIMLVNADGHFFAMNNACSHAGCALAQEGSLDGETIVCSCHGSQFDLQTGDVLSPPAVEPMQVYKVKVDGENVLVEL